MLITSLQLNIFLHLGSYSQPNDTYRIGDGQVVGWLSIVSKNSGEDKKLSYMNLKYIIWHESFFKLLKSIILYVKTGFIHECYDCITHWLYPLVLLLSADYEEHNGNKFQDISKQILHASQDIFIHNEDKTGYTLL
ncbi:hypothetical protein EDD22DRAFT_847614 [Suillus occidentalis]|nr:hypothetical protein EDD22DRAFT_847614 [Suillus occidentalis]